MELKTILKKIEETGSISFPEWEFLTDWLFYQQEKIKELTKSRDNWKNKYKLLKNDN